ncbi:hypothetical protein Tco_1542296 [Tanacetum coccineum]
MVTSTLSMLTGSTVVDDTFDNSNWGSDNEEVEVLSSDDERTKTDGSEKAGDEIATEENIRDEKSEDEKVEEEKAEHEKAAEEEEVIEEQAGDEQTKFITTHSPKQLQKCKPKIVIKKHKKPKEKADVDVVFKRLINLEKKVEAMSKVDHTEIINKSVQARLKKVLPKSVLEFGRVKQ